VAEAQIDGVTYFRPHDSGGVWPTQTTKHSPAAARLPRLADAGAHVVLLCASRGESGSVSDQSLVGHERIGATSAPMSCGRRRAHSAIADVLIYDHPDGDLRWADVPELHNEIVRGPSSDIDPTGVITFAEDGLYWHLGPHPASTRGPTRR